MLQRSPTTMPSATPNPSPARHAPKIAFFGTPEFAVTILNQLEKAGFLPSLVITNLDKPKGRKLVLTPPPVKEWVTKRNIKVIQPEKLTSTLLDELRAERWDMFIVAAYGKLIPKTFIELPLHGTLNVHPSLLPLFRGATPIQSAMLADAKQTGVSVMLIDEEMDHGPILGQAPYDIKTIKSAAGAGGEWPKEPELEQTLGELGGTLLAELIPQWMDRKIQAVAQEHHLATYTKKITKADGLINLDDDPYLNFRKIQAFSGWPGAYFFIQKKGTSDTKQMRITITEAAFTDGQLRILKVIPDGRKEVDYASFLNSL